MNYIYINREVSNYIGRLHNETNQLISTISFMLLKNMDVNNKDIFDEYHTLYNNVFIEYKLALEEISKLIPKEWNCKKFIIDFKSSRIEVYSNIGESDEDNSVPSHG